MLTVREHVQASAVKQLADLQVESLMKPDDAAKRLLEIASMVETSPEGRIFVERVTAVFLNEGGEAYEYRVGIELLKRRPDRHARQRYVLPLHREERAAVCLTLVGYGVAVRFAVRGLRLLLALSEHGPRS